MSSHLKVIRYIEDFSLKELMLIMLLN